MCGRGMGIGDACQGQYGAAACLAGSRWRTLGNQSEPAGGKGQAKTDGQSAGGDGREGGPGWNVEGRVRERAPRTTCTQEQGSAARRRFGRAGCSHATLQPGTTSDVKPPASPMG